MGRYAVEKRWQRLGFESAFLPSGRKDKGGGGCGDTEWKRRKQLGSVRLSRTPFAEYATREALQNLRSPWQTGRTVPRTESGNENWARGFFFARTSGNKYEEDVVEEDIMLHRDRAARACTTVRGVPTLAIYLCPCDGRAKEQKEIYCTLTQPFRLYLNEWRAMNNILTTLDLESTSHRIFPTRGVGARVSRYRKVLTRLPFTKLQRDDRETRGTKK